MKIGIENDNYLMYAVKNKAPLESLLYLIMNMPGPGFDFGYRNSVGNTVAHIAIRTDRLSIVKLMFVKDPSLM